MRIEARLEKHGGRMVPIIFFPDDVETDKAIRCYTFHDGHGAAERAYMRQCKKPATPDEFTLIFAALARYFSEAARYAAKR